MKHLYKSERNKVWSGVIGGLGEYFEIDPTVLRVAWIVVVMLTGFIPGFIAYIFAAMVVPGKHKQDAE